MIRCTFLSLPVDINPVTLGLQYCRILVKFVLDLLFTLVIENSQVAISVSDVFATEKCQKKGFCICTECYVVYL